jgi:lipoate-protein ligase A
VAISSLISKNTTWRLIDSGHLSGPENMAIDEALLHSFDPQISHPVLRLYGWEPASLSLGRFQKPAAVLDLDRCQADKVPVVRRVTGGGVIYHVDELTYSLVCAPGHIPPASSIKDSFRVLTGFLLAFYRGLGLEAAYAVDVAPAGTRLGERTSFCFAGKETFDILIGGMKIGGNAQRRQKGIIFQHGSIPLVNRSSTGLFYMRDRSPGQAVDTASLVQCGVAAEQVQLRQGLATAFGSYFGVTLKADALTSRECCMADELHAEKYLKDSWNLEGIG